MDYRRIYAEFIADRRQLSGLEVVERHHIVPRCIGGTDEPDNLIDLSPSDHFFAHLLLAKIYGGQLWVPVVLWCGGNKGNWRARKSRLNYAWAAQSAAKRLSGRGAWQYDETMHTLVHVDGRELEATQYDIADMIGGIRSGVNLLLRGRIKSYYGWRLPTTAATDVGRGRSGNNHPQADQRVHAFVHRSGDVFSGTRHDFCSATGVSRKSACLMVAGKQAISHGWSLVGVEIPTLGRATAGDNRLGGLNEVVQGRTQHRLGGAALSDSRGEVRREAA